MIATRGTMPGLSPLCTCEAGGPGDVQVEVLGGINEHVEVSVWLRDEGRGFEG